MLWPSLKWSSTGQLHCLIYLPVWLAEAVRDVYHNYNAGMPVGSLELLL